MREWRGACSDRVRTIRGVDLVEERPRKGRGSLVSVVTAPLGELHTVERLYRGVGRVEHRDAATGTRHRLPHRQRLADRRQPAVLVRAAAYLSRTEELMTRGRRAGVDRRPGRADEKAQRRDGLLDGRGVEQTSKRRHAPRARKLARKMKIARVETDEQCPSPHWG